MVINKQSAIGIRTLRIEWFYLSMMCNSINGKFQSGERKYLNKS